MIINNPERNGYTIKYFSVLYETPYPLAVVWQVVAEGEDPSKCQLHPMVHPLASMAFMRSGGEVLSAGLHSRRSLSLVLRTSSLKLTASTGQAG